MYINIMDRYRIPYDGIGDYERGRRDGEQDRRRDESNREYERGYRDGYGSGCPTVPIRWPYPPNHRNAYCCGARLSSSV